MDSFRALRSPTHRGSGVVKSDDWCGVPYSVGELRPPQGMKRCFELVLALAYRHTGVSVRMKLLASRGMMCYQFHDCRDRI